VVAGRLAGIRQKYRKSAGGEACGGENIQKNYGN